MQNTIQKFRQSSVVFKKLGILSENLETLTTSNYPAFCWNFVHVFYLRMSTKGCVGLFYLDLELFEKVKKDLVSTHLFFTLLLITQDLKKIRKIPLSRKRVQNFSKKY